ILPVSFHLLLTNLVYVRSHTSALTAAIQASSSSKVDPSSHGYPAHAHTPLQGQVGLSPQSVPGHGSQSLQ
ncbi:hypothetical protein M405DRAFT_833661, partial [Rhizopogon salebrosus TDB-379]